MSSTIKNLLLEYLTDEQRRRFRGATMSKEARAQTDHFFGVKNNKVEGSVEDHGPSNDKSEIHRSVEKHLGRLLTTHEYRSGKTTDKYGREVSIGKLIKDDSIRNRFASDKSRDGSRLNAQTMRTTTHRGVEVMGQTNSMPNAEHPNGHSWHDLSCKNNEDGEFKSHLRHEVKAGTLVHFVHDHTGKEIYRATLQPFTNHNGSVAYHVDSEHGVIHPAFSESAKKAATAASHPTDRTGIFKVHPKIYNDSATHTMFHPSATKEDLLKSVEHPQAHSDVLSHHLADDDVIEHAYHHGGNANIKFGALNSEHATPNILRHAHENDPSLRNRIIAHKNIPSDVLDKHVNNIHAAEGEWNKANVCMNPNLTEKHITKLLDDEGIKAHTSAVRMLINNKNFNASHRDKILASGNMNGDLLSHLARHAKADDKFVDHILSKGNHYVNTDLARNPSITSDHIHKIIKAGMTGTGSSHLVLNRKDVTKSHIDTAIAHNNHSFMASAMTGMKPTDSQVSSIIQKFGDDYSLDHAISGSKHLSNPEHLNAVLNNPKLTEYHKSYLKRNENIDKDIRDKI